MDVELKIHGDNIVECDRIFRYICRGLCVASERVTGPTSSITCPVYIVELDDRRLLFQFLPGYGEHRWNQDVLGFVKGSGGRLREAADAILTQVEDGGERPLAAIEFCGALPAGNQAWQRHGRAFSFAHSDIPYFFVAELGGFELDSNRERRAPRMPNPAVPFSFLAMTLNQGSVCLPVYEPNAGAASDTIERYGSVFGQKNFHEFLRLMVLGEDTTQAVAELCNKCIALVKLLAKSRKRQDGLTAEQWQGAYDAIRRGRSLPDFLITEERLPWNKTTSIESLTTTAESFMDLGARFGVGLTSSSLPLSLVPKGQRKVFAQAVQLLYPDLGGEFVAWLADCRQNLAIAWLMGFKPGGDDARPDRGLPPIARMLVGSDSEVMTFVYGPMPIRQWEELTNDRKTLIDRNGLWEAIFGVSNGVLVDNAGRPDGAPRGYLSETVGTPTEEPGRLYVNAKVRKFGEQDVDTALHVAFESLGANTVFEGMCNPPGGDWSGISFRWGEAEREFRWLTLPRVSEDGGKRPDHVFALFANDHRVVCLCVESKEKANSLGSDIGPRLSRYTEALFDTSPSIHRAESGRWETHDSPWQRPDTTFASAGAYLSVEGEPFRGLPDGTGLDMQIGVEFRQHARQCVLHLRGDTELGHLLVARLASHQGWSELVTVQVSN